MTHTDASAGAPPTAPGSDRWEARFRAPRVTLPSWAKAAPSRCLYVGNASGTFELYVWDRSTGKHRRVTGRPHGTTDGALDPTGEWVWWFADSDGDEFGTWRRQPFAGGPDEDAAAAFGNGAALPSAYPAGLALGHGCAVVGRSTDDGASMHLLRPGRPPQTIYTAVEDAYVVGLSRDETLLAIAHSEHGNSRRKALRVLRLPADLDGAAGAPEVVGDLWDGPGRGLEGVAFSPVAGDARLLGLHELADRPLPLVWDPTTARVDRLDVGVEGEVEADWYADGSALLVRSDAQARSQLYRLDLGDGSMAALPTPAGTIQGATARPDGAVELWWSSAAEPPLIRSLTGEVVLRAPGDRPPPSVPLEDVEVDGPDGRVHALVARPDGVAPYPTVFLLHGGPTWHDTDSFAADRAAWVDSGFAVVHVNYRGSTGYGTAWRDAIEGRPGLTELEDVVAVRAALVAAGVVDPARLVLAGGSWGGYLTLLGLGTSPDLWTLGVAAVPVADYLAAYEDEMEQLRAFDRSLFGGSPDELPELYRACSPITYVDAVTAPVLVTAGAHDPRCPLRQIENYLKRLTELGKSFEVYRFDAGHGSLVVEERVRQMSVEIDFAVRHLSTPA